MDFANNITCLRTADRGHDGIGFWEKREKKRDQIRLLIPDASEDLATLPLKWKVYYSVVCACVCLFQSHSLLSFIADTRSPSKREMLLSGPTHPSHGIAVVARCSTRPRDAKHGHDH